jgi:hypothetical protein
MISDYLSRICNRLIWVVPFFLYSIASFGFFFRGIDSGPLFQPYGDTPSYVWFLNWWYYALIHHINPFVSFYVWSPIGFNMLWATSVPTLALLAAPITWKCGPITSWNLLSLLAPAISAFAAYILLRYITRDRYASLVGGYLFGFSSYVLSQLLQHLNLVFVPLIPLFVLLALRRVTGDIGRIPYVVLMSLAAALQFGISTELLATAAFFGFLTYLVFYSSFKNTLDMRGLAKDTAISALVTVVVLAPAIYYLALGYEQVPDVINSAQEYSADLLNFIVPTPITRIGGSVFKDIASKFTGNFAEEGAYLGIPLLLAVFFAIKANKGRKWLPPVLLVLAATILFSLGPRLWIKGDNTYIPLPWQLLMHVPLLTHALPVRFAVYTALIISILISLWLSAPNVSLVGRLSRYSTVFVGALVLMPNTALYGFGKIETPALFSQKELIDVIGVNKTLVVLPYGYLGNSMYWQLSSNMSFRMAGGYVGFAPKYFASFPATSYFYGRNVPSNYEQFKNALYAFCVVHDVDAIVITPGTNPKLAVALERLPWQRMRKDSLLVLKVPERSKSH